MPNSLIFVSGVPRMRRPSRPCRTISLVFTLEWVFRSLDKKSLCPCNRQSSCILQEHSTGWSNKTRVAEKRGLSIGRHPETPSLDRVYATALSRNTLFTGQNRWFLRSSYMYLVRRVFFGVGAKPLAYIMETPT